jgi:hypothetical protein
MKTFNLAHFSIYLYMRISVSLSYSVLLSLPLYLCLSLSLFVSLYLSQITLTNKSEAETSFSFPKTAHYKMIPPSGALGPLQSLSAVLSFQPSQLGTFKSIAQLSVLDGLAYVSIKLYGESEPPEGKKTIIGGIDKFPEDFERKMKFVDPNKILIEKQESERHRSHNQGDRESKSITSTDRDKLYGMGRYFYCLSYLIL